MNLSLMSCQMMRVISSPSSSTTGFFTLIFLTALIFLDWVKAGPKLTAVVRAKREVDGCTGTLPERAVPMVRPRERRALEAVFMARKVKKTVDLTI